jgi:hypothetical protein
VDSVSPHPKKLKKIFKDDYLGRQAVPKQIMALGLGCMVIV